MTVLWVAALVAAFVTAWFLGVRRTARGHRQALARLAAEIEQGAVATDPRASEPAEVQRLRAALARGWSHRGREREEALAQALPRFVEFLEESVAGPLRSSLEAGGSGLREAAEDALGVVEDLEFFLEDPSLEVATADLRSLVQGVTREYVRDSSAVVKVRAPESPVQVQLDPDAFMDALYLVLHNAGKFGGGEPVEVEVTGDGDRASVVVRDRGSGFSAEALEQAYDPFYSTAPGGLGLGLPHARRVVAALGGRIHLRNRAGGGAEVEVSFARAR